MAKITCNQDSLKPRREFKRHQIQPGHNIYRILPPFGPEEVSNNYPYRRWSIAWLTDPETGRRKPYALPPFEKGNPDPISTYIALLIKKIDVVKKNALDKGIPEEVVKEKLADLNKLVWELRPKNGYFYNACSKSGEVGILELKKTAHDALKAEMYQYIKDYSQDPTSLNSDDDDSGVWFDFERVGEKGDKNTEYKVKKNQTKHKTATGKLTFEDDREALPEHVSQNFETLGYDIYNLYQAKTSEELMDLFMFNLREIVKTVPNAKVEGFDPDKYDFGGGQQEDTSEEPDTIPEEDIPFAPAPAVAVAVKAPVKLALKEEVADDDLESIMGTDAPKVAAPVKTAPAKTVAKPAPVNKKAPPTAQPSQEEVDVFALADSVLNG
jgi:hypothetical protein